MTQADPVLPANLPGTVGTTQRADGGLQVKYNGMPLYYWAKDQTPGDTTGENVGGVCATASPPLLTDSDPSGSDAVAAGLGTTQRTDGGIQVTYNGAPLYYWAKDQKPGDTTGQNVGGVWVIVNP